MSSAAPAPAGAANASDAGERDARLGEEGRRHPRRAPGGGAHERTPGFEKADERPQVRPERVDLEHVHLRPANERARALLGLFHGGCDARPLRAAPGVDLDDLTGLRVLEREETDRGQLAIVPISGANRHHVVSMRERVELRRAQLQGLRVDQEVGQDDDERASAQALPHRAESGREVRPAVGGLEGHELAHEAARVGPPARGRHEHLHPVGEADEADPVVAPERSQREHAGDLDRLLALGRFPGAQRARGAQIDDEDDGELALLPVSLDERAAGPRRRVPVDGADVVAGLVLADLVEIHAAAPEAGAHAAVERVVAETARADLDAVRLLRDALRDRLHGGLPSRRHHGLQHAADDLVAVDALGLRFEAQRDAVAEDVRREQLHVLRHDVAAALEEGPRARGARERDGPARRRAGAHQAAERSALRGGARVAAMTRTT